MPRTKEQKPHSVRGPEGGLTYYATQWLAHEAVGSVGTYTVLQLRGEALKLPEVKATVKRARKDCRHPFVGRNGYCNRCGEWLG